MLPLIYCQLFCISYKQTPLLLLITEKWVSQIFDCFIREFHEVKDITLGSCAILYNTNNAMALKSLHCKIGR